MHSLSACFFIFMLENLLTKIHQPIVRDLAWAVLSPCLLKPSLNHINFNRDEYYHWFIQLDQQPTILQSHIEQSKTHFLGFYFEALWQFFLCNAPGLQLIAHNIPIRFEGKTLGELDAVYCFEDTYYHVELAVKFYLYFSAEVSSSHTTAKQWIGPGCKDRLDLKMDRLLTHQMTLSQHEAAQEKLNCYGINQCFPQLVVKGMLFYPYNALSIQSPDGVSTAHMRGHWIYFKDLAVQHTATSRYCILKKKEWFSDNKNLLMYCSFSDIHDNLSDHFKESQFPVQISVLDNHNQSMTRLFVVPNHWPW